MPGRIPPEFIDQLIERVDVVDIIGARVPLKRAGKDFQARCPFHDEKTPSFTVAPDKQFYHCFGCGAHGTAIGFLMEYDRLGFREAVEELAHHAGLELPADAAKAPQGPDPAPLLALSERSASIYRHQLREHPQARRAVEYLKGRGLSGDIASRFGLGFAPPGWDLLIKKLGGNNEADSMLVRAGLVIERDDGHRYDRFRDRVMFPIRDRRGRVIGFGGRVLGDGEPKYLNSPETPIFHKGRELYGLHEAQQARGQFSRIVVVEGYMDVIALAQFGIPYAVATLGTATSPEHIKRLLRAAPELVFCFDGDRAGRAAAWKALETALPQATGQQPIRFLFLPEGEDPDTLVRQEGAAAFEQRLAHATLLSDFLFQELQLNRDMSSDEGRAGLDAAARPLLRRVPSGTFRDLLEQRLAKLTGVTGPARARSGPRRAGTARQLALTPIRLAIALLLDDPSLGAAATEHPDAWRELSNPGTRLLSEMLEVISAYPGISAAALCERWRETDQAQFVARLSDSSLIAHIPLEGRREELLGAIRALNRQAGEERRWRALSTAGSAELTAEQASDLRRLAQRAPDH